MNRPLGLRSRSLSVVVLCASLGACSKERVESEAPSGLPSAELKLPLFTNSGFETGNLSSWTVTTKLNNSGAKVTVNTEADLQLSDGGVDLTSVKNGAAYSLIPPGLTSGDPIRYPRSGSYAAVVNEMGSNKRANILSQTTVVQPSDIDPTDGLVHLRFTILPVLDNPGHTITSQPFYYVTVINQTTGAVLASRFNFSNQAGVPWKTAVSNASRVYTDWLLFDLPTNPNQVKVGDTVEVRVVAAGCSLGGHMGEAIVDNFGSHIPGLVAAVSGPDSAAAGSDFQYTYNVYNGSSGTTTGTKLTVNLPAKVTFRSMDTPGVTCTKPAVGGIGVVECDMGSIPAGASKNLKVTVRVDSAATGTISHGWYGAASNEEQALTGPLLVTTITPTGTVNYVDLTTYVSNSATGLDWGQGLSYVVIVSNNGPSAANGLTVVDNAPANLTGTSWSCVPSAGSVCGAASGAGFLNTTANLPSGGSVQYIVSGNVVAGAGTGTVNYAVTATAPVGVSEQFALDNTSADQDSIGGLTSLTVNRNGTGTGRVQSQPAGLSCAAGCASTSADFVNGSTIALQAVADPGSYFAGWSGDCAGTDPSCTLTVAPGMSATATFTADPVNITSALTAKGAVGTAFVYQITASGSGTLTYSASNLPSWASFNASTGVISGTPDGTASTNVTIGADNGSNSDSETLVLSTGVAPTITSGATFTISGASTNWSSITIAATGASTITYNASNLPGLVYFNSNTGQFNGAAQANGTYNVPVTATNGFGSDSKIIAVSVGGAPVITSALTGSGAVNSPFSYTFTATGSGTITRSVSQLPSWASFNATTGVISGTPTQAGTFTLGLSASSTFGTSNQTLVISVAGPATITSSLTATGTLGKPFSYSLLADGSTPITLFTSNMPAWAAFDSSTGLLYGTPTATGITTVTVGASNAAGGDLRTLTITVGNAPPSPNPPAITSQLSASAGVGSPFVYSITASGQAPMTYSATGLPAWASLDTNTGVITGTPDAEGTVPVTIGATNNLGSDSKVLNIVVSTPPSITSALTGTTAVGQSYSYTLTATGSGTITLNASTLPPGLSYNSGTSQITGTPTTVGTYNVTLTAANLAGADTETLVLTVEAAAAVTSSLSVDATVGVAFSYAITTAATNPVFSASSLPAWASFNATTGVISGTPDAETVHNVTIGVSNWTGSDSQTLVITVRTLPSITSALTAKGAVGIPFSYTLTATGTAPLTLGATGLPSGLSFSSPTISGTPSASGNVTVPLTATNAAGTDNQNLSLQIRTAVPTPTITSPASAGYAGSTPTISGTVPSAEAGGTVTVKEGTTTLCTATVQAGGAWSCVSSTLGEGSRTLTAQLTDPDNFVGAGTGSVTFTVDVTPPAAPVLTAPSNNAYLKVALVTFSGTAEPSSSVFIEVGGTARCNTTADGSGNFSCADLVAYAEASHSVRVYARDAANNASADTLSSFTVDLTAPNAPVVSSPLPNAQLNDTTPTFSGTGEIGSGIAVRDGVGTLMCTTTVDGAGNWSCESTVTLTAGPHTYEVKATDLAGNEGSAATGSLTIDLTHPADPTLSLPAHQSSTSDALTTFSGTAEPLSSVTVTIDGTHSCTGTADGSGNWTCQLTTALADGPHSGQLVARDPATNASNAVNFTYTVDTQAPGAPVVTGPNAPTPDNTPTLAGTGEVNAEVRVYEGATLLCSATVSSMGTWSCSVGTPLSDGAHTVSVTVIDAAQNTSSATLHTFTVDTQAPAAPAVQSPLNNAYTADATPNFAGTAEPGATVMVYVNMVEVCRTTANALTGAWTCESTVTLSQGSHPVSVEAQDAAGNTSSQSNLTLHVDLTVPSTPTLSAPVSGQPVNTPTPTFLGMGEAGTTVIVRVDGQEVCTALVQNDGSWSCTSSAPLGEGPHTFDIRSRNLAGTEGGLGTGTLTVDLTPPPGTQLEPLPAGGNVNTATPTFLGTGEVGATVRVLVDGQQVCTAVVGADGKWSCTSTVTLTDGAHPVSVITRDPAGNDSTAVTTTVTVDTAAPTQPTYMPPVDERGNVTTATPNFSGTAEPGATVTVLVDGAEVCTATADDQGTWSCTSGQALADGRHTVEVVSSDRAGNSSQLSAGQINVQTNSGQLIPPTTGEVSGKSTDSTTISGQATPGATVNVYVDGELVGTTTADEDGNWSFELPLLPPGEHSIQVGVVGQDGTEVFRSQPTKMSVRSPDVSFGGGVGCSTSSAVWAMAWPMLLLLGLFRRRGVRR